MRKKKTESDVLKLKMGEGKRDDVMQVLRGLRELLGDLNVTMEIYQSRAQLRKIKYDALLKEGFSEAQALTIVAEQDIF